MKKKEKKNTAKRRIHKKQMKNECDREREIIRKQQQTATITIYIQRASHTNTYFSYSHLAERNIYIYMTVLGQRRLRRRFR